MLFNSYLHREHNKEEEDHHLVDEDILKKMVDERIILSIDEKYELASNEADVLKESVKEGKKKSDALLETLKAVLDETDLAITEIRKDASDFQREIMLGSQNSRTGKIEAERIIKYRQMKINQKNALIEKLMNKKKTLNHQIEKIKNQLAKKQELGDDLKFIDFHQLQIENKKYLKEIKEKNEKLLDLKVETGRIVKSWNDIKQKLNKEVENKELKIEQIKIALKAIDEAETGKSTYEEKQIRCNSELAGLKSKVTGKNNETDVMNIDTFIDAKNAEKDNRKTIKDIERKIDIAKLDYKRSVYMLKKKRAPALEIEELDPALLEEEK